MNERKTGKKLEEFSQVYMGMEDEDKEKMVLAAEKLLVAQRTIRDGEAWRSNPGYESYAMNETTELA